MAAYDATVPVTLTRIVAALEKTYGSLWPQVTDPFEMIVMENVAYLVDDARRHETFERLRLAIGITPDAILKHSASEIAAVIADGGMKPEMRAEKVLECARLAKKEAALRKYPGVGGPLADRILLLAGTKVTLAPAPRIRRGVEELRRVVPLRARRDRGRVARRRLRPARAPAAAPARPGALQAERAAV